MQHFVISAEIAAREVDVDQVMDDLVSIHPSIGTSPVGNAEIVVTLPADSLIQAITLATAAIERATGIPTISLAAMSETDRDAREGFEPLPELLTIAEAAERLGISPQAARKRARVGTLHAQLVGRDYVVPASAVTA